MSTSRGVVLARGLGSRMRAPDPRVQLSAAQGRAADAGLKAMMPVNGRPFLDFVLSSLADAGIREVALIVAPDHQALRYHYTTEAPPSRVELTFLVQQEALGTAHAVLAAQSWAQCLPFLTVNGDNLYPPDALRGLAMLEAPGLCGFEAGDLVRSGNIPPERIGAFAVIRVNRDGFLTGIIEKPGAPAGPPSDGPPAITGELDDLVSMNCWRFDDRIFSACRDVRRSGRGEFELPEAVALALQRGVPFTVLRAGGPVLDLSRRGDAAELERRLRGVLAHP